MSFLDSLDPYVSWLSIGLLLCIAEMIIPGVFLLWLGIAALLTGVLTMLLPIGLALQLAAFAVLAVASVLIGRRWSGSREIASDDPLLNDRVGRLIGEIVIVDEAIVNGRGRVRVGDGVWTATGADAQAGTRLRVVGAQGGILEVAP